MKLDISICKSYLNQENKLSYDDVDGCRLSSKSCMILNNIFLPDSLVTALETMIDLENKSITESLNILENISSELMFSKDKTSDFYGLHNQIVVLMNYIIDIIQSEENYNDYIIKSEMVL